MKSSHRERWIYFTNTACKGYIFFCVNTHNTTFLKLKLFFFWINRTVSEYFVEDGTLAGLDNSAYQHYIYTNNLNQKVQITKIFIVSNCVDICIFYEELNKIEIKILWNHSNHLLSGTKKFLT